MKRSFLLLFFHVLFLSGVTAQQPLLLPCLEGVKWGYRDTNGTCVILPQFDDAENFTNKGGNGLYSFDAWYAPVKNGAFVNWIDVHGKKLFPFDSILQIDLQQALQAEFTIVSIRIAGEKNNTALNALINNKLRLIYPFGCADFQVIGCVDDVEFNFDWEKWNINFTVPPLYWNTREGEYQIRIEKCSGLQGILNGEGKVLVEPDFEWVSNVYQNKYLARLPQSTACLLYELPKKAIHTFPFTPRTGIHDGLTGVSKTVDGLGERCGFVDLNGRVIVPFRYTEIYGFYRGIALGQRPDKGWDIIDKKGAVRLQIREPGQVAAFTHHFFVWQDTGRWQGYDYQFRPFLKETLGAPPLPLTREGVFCYRVQMGADSVILDLKGTELSRYPCQRIPYHYKNLEFYTVWTGGKYGLLQRLDSVRYKEIFAPCFDMNPVIFGNLLSASINGKKGIADISGKKIVPFEWDNARIAGVYNKPDSVWIEVERNGRVGTYDTTGNLLIPCVLHSLACYAFMEGNKVWFDTLDAVTYLCDGNGGVKTFDSTYHFQTLYGHVDCNEHRAGPCFRVERFNKTGLMNAKGLWIIPPRHDQCKITYDGRYIVTLDTGIWSLQERETGEIGASSTDEIEIMGNDILNSTYKDEKVTYRVWNRNRKTMLESPYLFERFREGRAEFRGEHGLGFFDEYMNPVIPSQFSAVQDFENGMAIVEKNGRSRVIDKLGNVLIQIDNKDIRRVKGDYFLVKNENIDAWTLIKAGGKTLYRGVSSADTLSGNRFLISIGHWRSRTDLLKHALIDSAGVIVIDSADNIFPISTGAVYLKNGHYYNYGLSEESVFKAVAARGNLRCMNADSALWLGFVTGHNCFDIYGIQGLYKKDGTALIPLGLQSIELIKGTEAFSVCRAGEYALFDQKGRQQTPFSLSSYLEWDPAVPFCYFISQRDPENKNACEAWWVSLSGKRIGIKKKWQNH